MKVQLHIIFLCLKVANHIFRYEAEPRSVTISFGSSKTPHHNADKALQSRDMASDTIYGAQCSHAMLQLSAEWSMDNISMPLQKVCRTS